MERGCSGFGSMDAIGMLFEWPSTTAGCSAASFSTATDRAVGINAASPLPSTLRGLSGALFTGEDLLCELHIAFRSSGTAIVRKDGLSETWRFRQPNAPGDHGFEYLVLKEFA